MWKVAFRSQESSWLPSKCLAKIRHLSLLSCLRTGLTNFTTSTLCKDKETHLNGKGVDTPYNETHDRMEKVHSYL